MGNICSFNSPDLPRAITGADGMLTVPTFAFNPTNRAYLSVTGAFTFTNTDSSTVGADGFRTQITQTGVCQHSTKTVTTGSDSMETTITAVITPYLVGPDAVTTTCDIIRPSSTDAGTAKTTYTAFSCPGVVLTALPTGTYFLGFNNKPNPRDGDDDENVNFNPFFRGSSATNTFAITTPLAARTTTLTPEPTTTVTSSRVVGTTTSTTTLEAQPTSTTTKTAFSPTVTSTVTSTADPTKTTTVTVYTRTVTTTSVLPGRAGSTSTVTLYTDTTTQKSTVTQKTTVAGGTTTKSVSNCPSTCPNGPAPYTLVDCPASDKTCYTTPNGDKYQLECNTDRPGGDLRLQSANNMKGCIGLCSNTQDCVGVAYYPKTRQCYLKRQTTYSTPKSGVVGARLVSKANRHYARGAVMMRPGGNPDFTYPPLPTSTVTPAPSGTKTTTVDVTLTDLFTSTPPPSGVSTKTTTVPTTVSTTTTEDSTDTITQRVSADTTVTTFSSSIPNAAATTTVSKQSTKLELTTTTQSVTSAQATVTKTGCSTKYGY